MNKWKWKIVNINIQDGKMKLVVDFAYDWKEIRSTDEEGNEIITYDCKIEREILESPVVLTTDQIKTWLNMYWSNKYGALDALANVLNSIESLKGYTENYE